jgi:murein DD-endopeptidase MepM/ murein hydrolase activator NlpD
MQTNDNPTIRMQVFYYRNLWYCFWKPAIQKKIDAVANLISNRLQQHVVAPVSGALRHVNLPKSTQTRFVLILMAIVTLVVTPNVCPECDFSSATASGWEGNYQTLTASGYVTPNYDRGGTYQPKMVYPVGHAPIASPFGWRPAPCSGCSSNHDGVDFHVPAGTTIYAAMTGTVTFTGWDGGLGYHIVIDDGYGYVTYYGHMIDGSIPSGLVVGSHVNMGDVVGLVGCTGQCTGAHLHFGVREDGSFVDPMLLLQRYAS